MVAGMQSVCAFLLTLLLLGANPLRQEAFTPIAYGQSVEGELTDSTFRQLYVFEGRRGDILSIRMTVISGALDPYLVVTDAAGQGVFYSDDDGGNRDALLDSVRLPGDGRYYIIATRFGHEQGISTGTYQLSLQRLGSSTPSGSSLQYGDTVFGEISNVQPQVIYYFTGQRGDVINLRMIRTSGDLDSWLDVADSQGQILLSGDDDPSAIGTLDAGIINFVLPNSGVYVIQATRYGNISGTTRGSYTLTLENIPIEQRGRAPYEAILLDYGQNIEGALSDSVPQLFYRFEGRRGEYIFAEVERAGGNLDTLLILLDSEQRELARDDGGTLAGAQIANYVLTSDGDYYLMVTRTGFSGGQTEGEFTLSLDGRMGIGGDTLELLYDSSIVGVIDASRPFEIYLFQGEAGDVVSIAMNTLSGDLDPLLTLYDTDGKQIAFDDDGGDGQNAAILEFTLPNGGIYSVEASRLNRLTGTTSGNYEITLTLED